MLFKETVTTGHTMGEAQQCEIQLTPQVLTFFKKNHPYHIVIDDIQLGMILHKKSLITIFGHKQPGSYR